MKLLLGVAAAGVAILLLLVAAMIAVGSRLPKEHEASRSVVLQAGPADVYRTITDFGSVPAWRRHV